MVKQALSSTETLAVLREHKPMLAERFGVVELALFGSTVRDEAGPDSDVDILVSLDDRPGWTRFFDVQRYLEEALGRPVDLVVERALRAELRPLIEAEAIRV
ncbi:MAG: nucleotidyltransferase family protein [Chloroflexi bacterium]|nr:nucleotidyltransferase family protein [Chloroflexota bacterium]